MDALVVVFAQLEARTDLDDGGEDEGFAGLQLFHIDLGVTDRSKIFVADRCSEIRWHGSVDEFLEDHVVADLRVDDGLGRLAGTEPGDLHLTRDRAVGLVEILVELVGRHLDRELHGVLRGAFDGGLHGRDQGYPRSQVTTVVTCR